MATAESSRVVGSEEAPERNLDGRFMRRGDFHATMSAVADIALHAARDGEDPAEIGRVRFDAARDRLGLAVPSAQALTKRMQRPLTRIIKMALASEAERSFVAGHDHANETEDAFPRSLMVCAIKAAARELGKVPSSLDYDGTVARDNAARKGKGLPTNRLPHSATVVKRFGSWQDALREAGLISEGEKGPRPSKAPPAAETLDGFVTEHGFVPTSGYFSKWCQQSGIPLGRDFKPWTGVIESARTIRAARGEATPEEMTGTADAPPIDEIVRKGPNQRTAKTATRDDAIRSLKAWGRSGAIERGVPTMRGYKAWAQGQAGVVSATTLGRLGSFGDLVKEAGIG